MALVHGARERLFINNRLYAEVVNISYRIETGTRGIRGVDEYEPTELVAGPVSIVIGMSVLRQVGTGGPEGQGVAAPLEYLSLSKYADILILDRATDLVIFHSPRAKLIGQDWSMAARQIMSGKLTFECIGYENEYHPKDPSTF
jgi:hypothetical protein